MTLRLEVLHVPDCPNLRPLLDRLRQVTGLEVYTREISTTEEAVALGMAGSPTLLINGVDPFAEPDRSDLGLSCRLYRDADGRIVPAPTVEQLRTTIADATTSSTPSEVLSAWRTRTIPLDPVEKAAHQAILRAFATGRPPTPDGLDSVTAGSGRSTTDVLTALHAIDALRLDADGHIAIAYPFSARPTRHRVRISSGIVVHAMCAIDALGIAAMLRTDTRIDSVDVTTGEPITVTTTAGRVRWEPTGTVVFVGAEAGGGPSADCCCAHLNFFSSSSSARTWSKANPQVPGEVMGQSEALSLSARLFQPLLAD